MTRDWNIVDDEVAEATPPPDDARLNLHRVRLVTLERQAAQQSQQWKAAAAILAAIMAASLIVRAVAWMRAGQHQRWAIVAVVLSFVLLGVAVRVTRTMRRSR